MIQVYAGIVLLLIANLVFAQRLVRGQHPGFGWSKPFTILLPILFVITIGTIVCMVAALLVSFYTLDPFSRHAARIIQKYGGILLAVVAFLPFAMVGISSMARRLPAFRMTKTIDKFGEGSMRGKVAIVLVSATWLCVGASFRAVVTMLPQAPILVRMGMDVTLPKGPKSSVATKCRSIRLKWFGMFETLANFLTFLAAGNRQPNNTCIKAVVLI